MEDVTQVEDVTQMEDVTIESLASNGSGIGRLPDGKTVFVPLSAPGDHVRIRLSRQKKRWAVGQIEEVLEQGPNRVVPPCPYFGVCGGCSLQHLDYGAQLRWKRRFVVDALQRIGGLDVDKVEITPSDRELGYRNRLSLTVVATRAGFVGGFHKRDRPGQIVDLSDCLLGDESVRRSWRQIRAFAKDTPLVAKGKRARITLRSSDGEGSVLVSQGSLTCNPDLLLNAVPAAASVWQSGAGGSGRIAGQGNPRDVWFGEAFDTPGTAFTQVNRDGGLQLHEAVLQQVGDPVGRVIVDAYAGLSLHGRRLASRGATVVAIELDVHAVAAGRSAGVAGLKFIEGKVEDHLSQVLPCDVVILNPPRSGADQAVLRAILDSPPARIVYISCDPATLARDIHRLGSEYSLNHVQLFDLFPQTPHVETLVRLDRRVP